MHLIKGIGPQPILTMPPRVSIPGGLRPLGLPSTTRSFSATTTLAAPPRDGPPPHHTPSSTSSLLSLNRPKRGPNTFNSNDNNNAAASRRNEPERAVDAASTLLSRYGGRAAQAATRSQATADSIREQKVSNEYLREMPRRWQVGDVYSPHDLSPVEMNKWRRKSQRKGDVIDALGISPLDMYKVSGRVAVPEILA